MQEQQAYRNNIIHTLGWHRFDLLQKITSVRKEQDILAQNQQNLVNNITQAIGSAIKNHNTAKDLYISKLQEKIQSITQLINRCNAQIQKNQPIQADQELSAILSKIQSGLFAQYLKREVDKKPHDDLFLEQCAEQMLTNLEFQFKQITDSFQHAPAIHQQPVFKALLGQSDQTERDVQLRERPFFQVQEWKQKAIIKGLDKSMDIKIQIPIAPIGFYAVRDGGSLYLIGGKENNFKICKNIVNIDLNSSSVAGRIRMRMPRYYHSVAVLRKGTSQGYKSEIIIIGGENPECPCFDTKEEKIRPVIDAAFQAALTKDQNNNKRLSVKRNHHSGHANRFSTAKSDNSSFSFKQSGFFDSIVGGGKRDGPILRSCQMFDPQTQTTSSIAVLNFARKKCGVCAFGSIAYAFCGYGVVAGTPQGQVHSNYQFISTIERFDRDIYDKDKPETWWKVLNIIYKPLMDIAAVGVGDKIILIGGRDELVDESAISVMKDPYISNKYKPMRQTSYSKIMTPQVHENYDEDSLLKSLNEDEEGDDYDKGKDGEKIQIYENGSLNERMSFPNMASIDCSKNCISGFNMYGQSFTLNMDDIK